MEAFCKPRGGQTVTMKGIWAMLDQIKKARYDDSPWVLLLGRYDCFKGANTFAPCPAVWRRPKTGAIGREEMKAYMWDWRSASQERQLRHRVQHREDTRIQRY